MFAEMVTPCFVPWLRVDLSFDMSTSCLKGHRRQGCDVELVVSWISGKSLEDLG